MLSFYKYTFILLYHTTQEHKGGSFVLINKTQVITGIKILIPVIK